MSAELGIERDGSLQQERRDGLVLEAAGAHERVVDGRQIVPVLIKRGANRVEITKRRQELQRARQQAFALKQLQQPPGAGLDEAAQHRWHHDRAGVDQQLCARRAGEGLFPVGVEAVGIGAGGDSQQAALTVPFVSLPGQQRGVFSQQSLQAFDVVVVNDAVEPVLPPTPDLCRGVCSLQR